MYVAGLFDGEGHCRWATYQATKNGKRYWREIASITNTNHAVLVWVCKTLGLGSVCQHSPARRNRKRAWRWQATHDQARKFLVLIRPYCRIKVKDIKSVLEE
jgi:hypothetical protein